MTLRDIGSTIQGIFERIFSDLSLVWSEPFLDWPIWIVVVGSVALVAFFGPVLRQIKDEEASPELDDGFWGNKWVTLGFFVVMAGITYIAFSESFDLPRWLGYVGILNCVFVG